MPFIWEIGMIFLGLDQLFKLEGMTERVKGRGNKVLEGSQAALFLTAPDLALGHCCPGNQSSLDTELSHCLLPLLLVSQILGRPFCLMGTVM